jgi:membrane associated rhomboid family serine protease
MDQVLLNWWRDQLTQLLTSQSIQPSYNLGITSSNIEYSNWITYQFVHSGLSHFFGNMIFLLIFGCFLEPIIGSLAFLLGYLLSGMVAAGTFLLLSGVTAVPLIGASGSVSGIMAIFCVLFWKHPVRYIYFLFIPKRGYAGYVYLPGWITLCLWVLADLAGYLGTWGFFGGIAHSAHLGGELAGCLVGILVLTIRQFYIKESFQNVPAGLPMGTTIS